MYFFKYFTRAYKQGIGQKVQNAQMSINIFTINEKLKATKMHGSGKKRQPQCYIHSCTEKIYFKKI